MARDTLFEPWLGGKILRSWNCVPISRDRGDLGALRTMLRLLKEGKAVLMFPEGTRSPDGSLQEARACIGMIAAHARCPIMPMRIFGTDKALPRGASFPRPAQVSIVFGEPFTYNFPADFKGMRGDELKAVYLDVGREVMRRISELRPH